MSRSDLISLVSRLQQMGMQSTAESVLIKYGSRIDTSWIEEIEIMDEPPIVDFSDVSLDELLEACMPLDAERYTV